MGFLSDVGAAFASGGGSIFTGTAAAAGDFWANDQARKSAHEQMDFQEMMSNTAHRREIQDLRLAGLNPILSARYGGASTPSGTAFSPTNPVAPAIDTALKTANLGLQAKSIEAQTGLNTQSAAAQTATARKTAAEAWQLEKLNEHYAKHPEALYVRDQKGLTAGLGSAALDVAEKVGTSAKDFGKKVTNFFQSKPDNSLELEKQKNSAFKLSHPLRR